jgi:hypothetical protein
MRKGAIIFIALIFAILITLSLASAFWPFDWFKGLFG